MYIKGCPALIDFVIVDMPEDSSAPIILGHPFIRPIKALINLHEGNVSFNCLRGILLLFIFPGRKEPGMMSGDRPPGTPELGVYLY